jgi:hypothetical protein
VEAEKSACRSREGSGIQYKDGLVDDVVPEVCYRRTLELSEVHNEFVASINKVKYM